MAKKQVALGSVVKLGTGAAGALETHGQVASVNPPSRERARVEGDALEDLLSVPGSGIEAVSEFTFEQFHDMGDDLQEKVDDEFEDQEPIACELSKGDEFTWTFNAKVMSISSESGDANSYYRRTVTMVRTGPITRT